MMGVMMLAGALMPQTTFAAKCGNGGSGVSFFGLDSWYAELECDGGEISQENFKSDKLAGTVLAVIGTVVKDLMFIGGMLAVVMLIYAGVQYITSAGNPVQVAKASKTITASVTGLVIAILAYAIVTTLLKLVGA